MNFLETFLMDFKMLFSAKITLLWIQYKLYGGFILKNLVENITIHSHTLTVTSPSPSVSDRVVHFELTISTAIAQLDETFHFIYILEWSRGCFQLYPQQFRWRWYPKTDFEFGLNGPDYPRMIEKYRKFYYK